MASTTMLSSGGVAATLSADAASSRKTNRKRINPPVNGVRPRLVAAGASHYARGVGQ